MQSLGPHFSFQPEQQWREKTGIGEDPNFEEKEECYLREVTS